MNASTGFNSRDLVAARAAAGDSQLACAKALKALGASKASQSMVSRWENGSATPSMSNAAAIEEYCAAHSEPQEASTLDLPTGARRLDVSARDFERQFEWIVRHVTEEPLLGERQGRLVDALIDRLGTGPQLTPEDRDAMTLLGMLLRLVDDPER